MVVRDSEVEGSFQTIGFGLKAVITHNDYNQIATTSPIIEMGKGIILDNGKKARGAMSLYWKKHKDKEKEKKQPSQRQEATEEVQEPILSSYDKWKTHQESMVIKKYTKDSQQTSEQQSTQQHPKVQKPEIESYDTLVREADSKAPSIPGYSSKATLHKKLHKTFEKGGVKATLSSKVVPDELKDLFSSPEELQRILQSNKQKNAEKLKRQKNKSKDQPQPQTRNHNQIQSQDPFEKTLHDDKYNPVNEGIEEEDSEPEEAPKKEDFFKSELLNKIAAGMQPEPAAFAVEKQEVAVPVQVQTKTKTEPRSDKFVPRSVMLQNRGHL